jgi:hypothetical protein
MSQGRFKNSTFNLANADGNIGTWERVAIAALYDIRDELQRLNATLACPRFLDIPSKLDRIEKNTKKRRKPKKATPKLRVVRTGS